MKDTELLDPFVRVCIRKRGFLVLSDAQKQAIPLILEGHNLILIAPTCTGKIESAMFPVFTGFYRRGRAPEFRHYTLRRYGRRTAIVFRACSGDATKLA